jgi:hypothetical protein
VQFKVPQNIDMADRIVGPLTLVQFLYLLVGGLVLYFLLNTVEPVNGTLFFALGIPVTLFSLALAFLRVQDQPFPKFVGAFIMFLFSPKTRIWAKAGVDDAMIIAPDAAEVDTSVQHKKMNRTQLERLVQTLDTAGRGASAGPAAQRPSAAIAPPNYLKRGRPTLDNVRR